MIHIRTTIDPETTGAAIVRPKIWTPTEQRRHLAEMRQTARDILAGRQVISPASPKMLARYGRTFPTLIGLRFRIGYLRNAEGWQRLRRVCGATYRDQLEVWVERKQEMRSRHLARAIQKQRRTRRVL